MSQNEADRHRPRDRSRDHEHHRHRDHKRDRDHERDRKIRDRERERERDRHQRKSGGGGGGGGDSKSRHHRRSDRSPASGGGGGHYERDGRSSRGRGPRRHHSRSGSAGDRHHGPYNKHYSKGGGGGGSNFSGKPPHSGSSGEEGRMGKRPQRDIPIVRAVNGNGGMFTDALDSLAMYANSVMTRILPIILQDGGRGEGIVSMVSEDQLKEIRGLGQAVRVLTRELFPEQNSGVQEWNQGDKLQVRIALPKEEGVNYIGLLIGPGGVSQKKMEAESGCKILVKGDEQPHVLIIGESQANVSKAKQLIYGILNADEKTRDAIRDQQTRDAGIQNHLLTPYGPPSPDAYVVTIPNDIVGLIIGKGGETIRQLQAASGAKIQVAKADIPHTQERNVFIEGPVDKYNLAQRLINDIIIEHKKMQAFEVQPPPAYKPPNLLNHKSISYPIPLNLTGMVIGRGGDTLKSLMQRTGAIIEVPKAFNPQAGERVLTLTGNQDVIQKAKQEISNLLSTVSFPLRQAKYTKSPLTGERQNLNGVPIRPPTPLLSGPPSAPSPSAGFPALASSLYGPPSMMQPMGTGYAGFQMQGAPPSQGGGGGGFMAGFEPK